MADEEMRYTTAVGPLPILTDPSTWAPAWAREEARPDMEDTLAHAAFRGIDPARPANPFAKQIVAMPHALVPSLDDRAFSITVVRRSRELEYPRLYLGFLNDAPADPPLVPTFDCVPSHAYAADDLYAGRRTPWAIFRSEWALEAAVVLIETFRNRRVLWRFPPRLLDWIRALGPANICVGPGGPDAEATAILGALLDLADQLPDTEAFRQHLRARSTDRRDSEGWVWAGLEMENNEACAKVAQDLRPFELPYTADILAARSYGDDCRGCVTE